MNKVIIKGNIVRDIELKKAGDTSICEFTIADSVKVKDKEYTEYIPVKLWGRKAEVVAQYCKKGSPILVEGSFKTDSWEKDGVKKYKSYVNAFSFEFCGGQKTESQDNFSQVPTDISEELPF